MTKKKPDFLRDLDTAIMDELTGGGIKGNAAGLLGTLTQIKEIKQLCGLPFCGYMAKLERTVSVTLCWDNLEALCQDCHNKEHHKQERHKRYRFDENGGILPPISEK